MSERRLYGTALVALLVVEILIARFVDDAIVRPYVGDALAVILAYAGFRSIFGMGFSGGLVAALLLATAIEIGQAFHLVQRLGLGDNFVARVALGQGFDWLDFVLYAVGGLAVVLIEAPRRRSGRRGA